MKLEAYAMKILTDNGCDCYTYGGDWSKHILDDLKEGYPDGMEYGFRYVDVANAILAISRPEPIKPRAPWKMVWSTDDCTDGADADSYEQAKCDCEDTLVFWMTEERNTWKDPFNPTGEELDNYNYMIDNFYTEIYKYDPDSDEYEEYDGLTWEEEESIGWKELTREDIEKEKRSFEDAMKKED